MTDKREDDKTPDSLADMQQSVVMNPRAVGNPDETPRVFVGAALARALGRCGRPLPEGGTCGGVNGFHHNTCPINFDVPDHAKHPCGRFDPHMPHDWIEQTGVIDYDHNWCVGVSALPLSVQSPDADGAPQPEKDKQR